MPSRAYDPRRYGPTVSTSVPPASRDVRSAPAATLSGAREASDNLQFAKSLIRGTRAKRADVGLWTDSQRGDGRVGGGSYEPALSSDDSATPKEDRCDLEA